MLGVDPLAPVPRRTSSGRHWTTPIAAADFVTLHLPLTPVTRHMIDAATLARMRAGAMLVNTCRGGLVDEAALVAALAAGRLGGALLDVFEREPLPADSPLLAAERVVLSAHAAWYSPAALAELPRQAAGAGRRFSRWEAGAQHRQPRLRDKGSRPGGGDVDDELRRALSRREMLRRSGGLMALAGLAPLIAACGGSDSATTSSAAPAATSAGSTAAGSTAAAPAGDIKMWWWGEQEAVGIQKWMDDAMSRFTAERGGKVDALLMDTDQVIPQFTKAAAAGDVPDVQFLFNGIYHMENVWLGYLSPLDTLAQPGHDHQRRRHEAVQLPGQAVPHRLLRDRLRHRVQQGPVREGRPRPEHAAHDVGRVHRGQRQAEGVGRHPDLAAASRTASSASGTSSTR